MTYDLVHYLNKQHLMPNVDHHQDLKSLIVLKIKNVMRKTGVNLALVRRI